MMSIKIRKKKTFLILVSCISVLVLGIAVFSLSGEHNSIAGTWEGEILNYKSVYVFNKDGTYESFLQSTVAEGTHGTYYVQDDFLILTGNDGKVRELQYSITDNTLIFKTKLGNRNIDVILTRK